MPLAPVGGTICALSPAREQPAVLHRLDHEAAHRRDAFLQHLALCELARAAEPLVQLVPDARVRPVLDLLVVVALQIEPRQIGRAHGVERKAAVGVGIDQLVVGRRRSPTECRASRTGSRARSVDSTPSGMLGRQMPWKPSQPAMKSQSISCALPSWLNLIFGRAPVRSCTLTPSTSNSKGPPSARRCSTRSFTTSCWP